MTIEVGIEIVNDRDIEVVVELPIGSIFEVSVASGAQNVATSQPYVFTIPPKSRLHTPVRCVCLNQDRSIPYNLTGRPTPFRYDSEAIDQSEVWATVGNPRASDW